MNPNLCPTCHSPIAPDAPGGFCAACLLRDAEEISPGGTYEVPSLEEVSAAFLKLEVLEFIGQGGMGFVYKVRQPGLDRIVALKILSPALGRDPAFEERFAREARVLGQLQHPNIVAVFEHGEEGGFFYLLMEYVDGINLRQAMHAGRFSPEQALDVVPGICDALQAAHAQGICHRDIKPENILLDREGRVKIVDFGIALIGGDQQRNFTLTATGGALGSAAYMAPEQHERPHDVDHRADIYSLGVVLYEMLTGELPLGRFPAPSERARVNQRVDEIVFRTLEKERDLRQQSAEEVKTAVTGVGSVTPTEQSGEAVAEQPQLSRLVGGAIALWVAGAALGGLGIFLGNTVAMSVGGALFAVGFLGCLWSLWEMKTGQLVLTGRALLIALTVVPMCMGIIAGLIAYGGSRGSFPRIEGGLLYGGITILVMAFPLFWVALFFGRPLKASQGQLRGFGKALLLLGGIVAVAGGGIYAKYHDGKWPMVGYQSSRAIKFDDRERPADPELGELVRRAAGDYADDYLLEVIQGKVKITATCLDRDFERNHFRGDNLSQAHVRSFYERLSWLIPLDQFPRAGNSFVTRVNARGQAAGVWSRITTMMILGALLVSLAGGRKVWLIFGSGVAVFAILAVLPTWANNSSPPRLITGPPMDSFDDSELAPPDFSSPEKAVISFHDAVYRGRQDVVRHGASEALRAILDENDEWEELLGRASRRAVFGKKIDRRLGMWKVISSTIGSGGSVYVVKEDGEWRVDSLTYSIPKRGDDGPFSISASPAAVMRSLIEAAKNGNLKDIRKGLSSSFLAEWPGESTGYLGDVRFVEVTELSDEKADVVVEPTDGSKRRLTLVMVLEDGRWKLSGDGL